MEIIIDTYSSLPCCCKLTINGVPCDHSIFVESHDDRPEDAPEYGCGYMISTPNKISYVQKELKLQYPENHDIANLSVEMIETIQEKLCAALHVGICSYCA